MTNSKSYWVHRERHWRLAGIVRGDGEPFKRQDYDLLLNAQFGECALCHTPLGRRTNVDHEHLKGKKGPVRGILHPMCNRQLANLKLKDAKAILAYLARFERNP